MKEDKDIKDNQIRVIGEDTNKKKFPRAVWVVIVLVIVALVIGGVALLLTHHEDNMEEELMMPEPALFEPEPEPISVPDIVVNRRLSQESDSTTRGYTEIRDTIINDIHMRIYIPHNAEFSLHLGRLNRDDNDIIYAAQAADVRADNGGIVGAYVIKGVPRAWGLSKKGYCASIDGKISIGMADNSPLFEQATERGGYFFRQYPLVSNGVVIDNEPKGKAIRRGICDRRGEIFMAETLSIESFHDFAQALADLGTDNAIYLVGSTAYGYAVDKNDSIHEFGENYFYKGRRKMPKNTNYIVWRRK